MKTWYLRIGSTKYDALPSFKKLNIETIVLSDSEYGPAKNYCDEYFFCNYNDEVKLKEFAKKIDVATLEFENISFKVLKQIEKFVPLHPRPEVNRIVQNRELEKISLGLENTNNKICNYK